MTDKRVNRYRSGAKRPSQEVLTSQNDDGTMTVVVADMAQGRIQSHTFPGGRKTDSPWSTGNLKGLLGE